MDNAEPPTQTPQEKPKQEQVQGVTLSVEELLTTRLNFQERCDRNLRHFQDETPNEQSEDRANDYPLTVSGEKTVKSIAKEAIGNKEHNEKEVADSSERSGQPGETIAGGLKPETLIVEQDDYLIDPANLDDLLPPLDIDEDLLSALRSLQIEDGPVNNQDEPFDLFPLEDNLEELEVDQEEEELLPLQDFSGVFDEREFVDTNVASLIETIDNLVLSESREEDEAIDEEESPWQFLCRPCQPETSQQYTDPTAGLSDEELLQLSLLNSINNLVVSEAQEENEPIDEEDFPWYLLCRPCQPDTPHHSSHPTAGLSDEDLLQYSLLAMADNSHVLDNDNDYGPNVYEDSFQSFIVSRRYEAVDAARMYTTSFGTGLYQPPVENQSPINERECLGHKETIYGVNFSDCGTYLATASQDATVRVWDVASNSLLSTLTGHNKDYECLRTVWAPSGWPTANWDNVGKPSFIASGGADGIVKIWRSLDPSKNDSWECIATLDHSSFEGRTRASDDEDGIPQIYALQFIDHWQGLASEKNGFLMTSSDDYVHLWEMDKKKDDNVKLGFTEVFSIRFTAAVNIGNGVSVCPVTSAGLKVPQPQASSSTTTDNAYGGQRNPSNIIYVFDASYCPGNGLLGAALSDGSLRLVNGRGVCVSTLSLPSCRSHLTSFAWDSTGTRLASCVATGHLILWSIANIEGQTSVSCVAVLEGGHQPGRPLFGAKYCGVDGNEDLIVSWGVDGRLCLWDSHSHGQIHAPISTLISRQDYPIYAVDVSHSVLAAGGGRDAGFLGVPLYLYNVNSADDNDEGGVDDASEEPTETSK